MAEINSFAEAMTRRSDADLIEIVTALREDYQPEAVVAAEEEIKSRKLSSDDIAKAKTEFEIRNQLKEEKASVPLGVGIKALNFLFPALFSFILGGIYKADGYDRKAAEAWRWTFYGFGFYFSLVLLMITLSNL